GLCYAENIASCKLWRNSHFLNRLCSRETDRGRSLQKLASDAERLETDSRWRIFNRQFIHLSRGENAAAMRAAGRMPAAHSYQFRNDTAADVRPHGCAVVPAKSLAGLSALSLRNGRSETQRSPIGKAGSP